MSKCLHCQMCMRNAQFYRMCAIHGFTGMVCAECTVPLEYCVRNARFHWNSVCGMNGFTEMLYVLATTTQQFFFSDWCHVIYHFKAYDDTSSDMLFLYNHIWSSYLPLNFYFFQNFVLKFVIRSNADFFGVAV